MNSIKHNLAVTLKPLLHKPIVLAILFGVAVLLLGNNTPWQLYELKRQSAQLEREKLRLQNAIEQDKRKLDELRNNRETLEKYAREEYFMKRDNEVVFLVK